MELNKGYGIDMRSDDFKLKEDAYSILWNRVKDEDWIKKDYEFYCSDKGIDPEDEGCYLLYIGNYENDDMNRGFEAFLLGVINVDVDPINKPFYCKDHHIIVLASVPENDAEKASMLTQEKIREILADHVNSLVENPVVIGWHTVTED